MAHINDIKNLPQQVAQVISNADGESASAVKPQAKVQLQEMLSTGQISPQEYKDAKKVLKDVSVMKAVAASNRMEASQEAEKLNDKKAQAILESTGLSVDDLYNIAQKFAGADNKVSYTHLNLSEKRVAKEGEETSSERYNVLNALNDKIKENGGDKVLTLKEAKILMKGLGCDVEAMFNPVALLGSMGAGAGIGAGAAAALPTTTVSATATAVASASVEGAYVASSTVIATKTATAVFSAASSAMGPLAIGGAIVAGTALTLGSALRKETPYGHQGGEEGGQGSVTNKTEAKMKALDDATKKVKPEEAE